MTMMICLATAARSSRTLLLRESHGRIIGVKINSRTVSGVGLSPLRVCFSSESSNDGKKLVLSHPSDVDTDERGRKRGRIVCITSGKGGVGKTTSAASFAYGLAERGRKTCVVDFDIGLRNLDIHLGMERRVIFDFVNVLFEECTLHQALIKDKRNENLKMLAASQTRDKDSLTVDGVERVLAELAKSFDYVVLDSPAGIESGARHAMYFADDAIIVTNPELSSCRDADKMVGFVSSRSRRAEIGVDGVSQTLLITRYDPNRVRTSIFNPCCEF